MRSLKNKKKKEPSFVNLVGKLRKEEQIQRVILLLNKNIKIIVKYTLTTNWKKRTKGNRVLRKLYRLYKNLIKKKKGATLIKFNLKRYRWLKKKQNKALKQKIKKTKMSQLIIKAFSYFLVSLSTLFLRFHRIDKINTHMLAPIDKQKLKKEALIIPWYRKLRKIFRQYRRKKEHDENL